MRTKIQGLFCATCRKTKAWDKFRTSYSHHAKRNVTERSWFCRDCGSLVKVETVVEETTD